MVVFVCLLFVFCCCQRRQPRGAHGLLRFCGAGERYCPPDLRWPAVSTLVHVKNVRTNVASQPARRPEQSFAGVQRVRCLIGVNPPSGTANSELRRRHARTRVAALELPGVSLLNWAMRHGLLVHLLEMSKRVHR